MNSAELKTKFPNASESFIRKNSSAEVRADDAKPTQGDSLVCYSPREDPGRRRLAIRFIVYSTRPADWDGYSIKECQDLLIHAGILDSDSWDTLVGTVSSKKVHAKVEERTEVEIFRLD